MQGVVDMNVSEGAALQVKMEQADPLAKSSSEYGGSEEEREELGDKASDDDSVNISSLLGNSYEDHVGNINEEAVGGEDKRDADSTSVLDNAKDVVGASKAGQSGVGAEEIEVILIDSESEGETEEGVALTAEDVIRTIKLEPNSDGESGRGARLPKEPDTPEEYGTDVSIHSGEEEDPEAVVDDEVDDRSKVFQHHADGVDDEHEGGGVDDEHEGGGVDDEAIGDVQLNEEYGIGWIKEMAVAHDDLFYRSMVRSCRGVRFIRGFIISFYRELLVPGSSSRRYPQPWTGRA